MNILMVGDDARGSWQMRAVQLGGAIGARVTTKPLPADWAWADLVVLVKRAAIRWKAEARRAKVPVVWDVLDFWAQPDDNDLPRDTMIAKVRTIQQEAGVSVLIAATPAMAHDIGGVYLPHHCRIGLQPTPIREKAEVVAYEGQRKYLGRWAKALQNSCDVLGLKFVVNPPDIRDADVLVSFRDGRWDGWLCQQWKSGVKHVNALVAGRPIVCSATEASDALRSFALRVRWIEELADTISLAASLENRSCQLEISRMHWRQYRLPSVATEYFGILSQIGIRAA